MIRKTPKISRDVLKAEAAAALIAFKEKGGVIGQQPAVVATTFNCSNCGHSGVAGARVGARIRCPRCREMIDPK